MKRHWTFVVLSTLLLAAGAGCNSDQACALDDDCFRGEFCIDGSCGTDPAAPDGGSDGDTSTANNGSDASGGNNGTDAGGNNGADDMSGGNNANNSNNGGDAGGNNSTDAGGDDGGTTMTDVCVADPFDASCRADDNDSFREYIFFDGGAPGCDNNDDFAPASGGIVNAQICALEEQDLYDINLVPCDDLSFIVDITVTPMDSACTHAHYDLNVNVQGNDCDNPGDTIRCEGLPNGVKRVSAIVEPSNSLASARIDVTKLDFENAHFDYDLDIVVRQ